MKKILTLFLLIIFLCPQGVFAAKKSTPSAPAEGSKGYIGTLPDVEARFKKTQTSESQAQFDYEEGFDDKTDIKPAPRNDPAFVNIIVKKDKTSQYINDLNEIITILEQLETIMEDKDSNQIFTAKAYFLKENVDYFRNKYKNQAESSYISFKKVMRVNTHVQSVALLRQQREVYSPYITAESNGNSFTQNNINVQLDYLLDDVKDTIVILKEAK